MLILRTIKDSGKLREVTKKRSIKIVFDIEEQPNFLILLQFSTIN